MPKPLRFGSRDEVRALAKAWGVPQKAAGKNRSVADMRRDLEEITTVLAEPVADQEPATVLTEPVEAQGESPLTDQTQAMVLAEPAADQGDDGVARKVARIDPGNALELLDAAIDGKGNRKHEGEDADFRQSRGYTYNPAERKFVVREVSSPNMIVHPVEPMLRQTTLERFFARKPSAPAPEPAECTREQCQRIEDIVTIEDAQPMRFDDLVAAKTLGRKVVPPVVDPVDGEPKRNAREVGRKAAKRARFVNEDMESHYDWPDDGSIVCRRCGRSFGWKRGLGVRQLAQHARSSERC